MTLPECKKKCGIQYNISNRMSPLPNSHTVAMAYVPYQKLIRTYEADQALDSGTLFPELDKPFFGGGVVI